VGMFSTVTTWLLTKHTGAVRVAGAAEAPSRTSDDAAAQQASSKAVFFMAFVAIGTEWELWAVLIRRSAFYTHGSVIHTSSEGGEGGARMGAISAAGRRARQWAPRVSYGLDTFDNGACATSI